MYIDDLNSILCERKFLADSRMVEGLPWVILRLHGTDRGGFNKSFTLSAGCNNAVSKEIPLSFGMVILEGYEVGCSAGYMAPGRAGTGPLRESWLKGARGDRS